MPGLIIRLAVSVWHEPGLNFSSGDVRNAEKRSEQLASHFSSSASFSWAGICRSEISPLPCLSGCWLGCSGYTFPLPSLLVRWAPVHVGIHVGGTETTNWPHLSSSTAPPWPPISPGPAKRPPPTLAPVVPRTQQSEWAFKNVILLALSLCCFTHQWLPVVRRIKSKCLHRTYPMGWYLAVIHWWGYAGY